MSVSWIHDGKLIGVLVDGQLSSPFMYIVADAPPPWRVEAIDGPMMEFDSLEAAQLAVLLAQKEIQK